MQRALFVVSFLLATSLPAQQFSVYATGGKSMTGYHGQDDVQSLNLEWTRRQWKFTDVGAVIASEFLWQPNAWFGAHAPKQSVRGLSTSLIVRHSFQAHPRLYAEVSSGPMWSEKEVPAATSRFNFLSQGGAGVVIGSGWQTPVILGVRVGHLSNGGTAHPNPGLNFSAIVVGLRFRP